MGVKSKFGIQADARIDRAKYQSSKTEYIKPKMNSTEVGRTEKIKQTSSTTNDEYSIGVLMKTSNNQRNHCFGYDGKSFETNLEAGIITNGEDIGFQNKLAGTLYHSGGRDAEIGAGMEIDTKLFKDQGRTTISLNPLDATFKLNNKLELNGKVGFGGDFGHDIDTNGKTMDILAVGGKGEVNVKYSPTDNLELFGGVDGSANIKGGKSELSGKAGARLLFGSNKGPWGR